MLQGGGGVSTGVSDREATGEKAAREPKKIKLEREEVKEEEQLSHERKGNEWKVTQFGVRPLFHTDNEILLPWDALWHDFVSILSTLLHKKIPLDKCDLPISVNIPLWPLLAHFFKIRFGDQLTLRSRTAVQELLGRYARKEFPTGEYAVITPPLTLKWEYKRIKDQNHVHVEVYCEVYNDADVILWPLHWDKVDDEDVTSI